MTQHKRALISVADKRGVEDFARGLVERGYQVVTTGGTLKALEQAGVPAVSVSEVIGVPEILAGRVKTLHPMIFAGILARRHIASDMDTLGDYGIEPIDVVAVNLQPFAAHEWTQFLEGIDVGGPALLRSAAKNHPDLYVVVDPEDYPTVLTALSARHMAEHADLRRRLAAKVFEHTARYDRRIADHLKSYEPPDSIPPGRVGGC